VRSAAGGSRQPAGCHQGCRAGVLHGPWALASVRSRTSNSCARVMAAAQESVQETASDGHRRVHIAVHAAAAWRTEKVTSDIEQSVESARLRSRVRGDSSL